MADARNRNKLVVTSLGKPTWVCTEMGPDCVVVCKTYSASSASVFHK